MTAVHPFIAPLLWLRFLPAAAAILGLPGWLLVGRHLRGGSWLDRGLISCAAGLLLVPSLAAPLRWLDLPLRFWTYLPVALVLALVVGRFAGWRTALGGLDLEPSPGRRGTWLILACCLMLLAGACVGFSSYCVPPHHVDGSNHAFLIQRVAATGSTADADIFDSPWGSANLRYLPGWHAAAALIAVLGGVAPYVAMWLLCIVVLCFLPATLGLLWRRWGLSGPALVLAAAFVAADQQMPFGLFTWGGYGIIMGTFVVPWCVLLLERTWRGGPLPLAALAGLSLGALLHIHATEVLLASLLSLLTLAVVGRDASGVVRRPGRWHFLILLAGLAFLSVEVVILHLGQYLDGAMASAAFVMRRLGHTFEIFVHAAGSWEPLQLLWVAGLAMGLWRRRTRPLALSAVVVGSLAGALGVWRDPVSLFLSTPFYGQAHRVYDVLIYLLAPLMTLPVAFLWRRSRDRHVGPLPGPAAVSLAVVVVCVLPAQRHVLHVYEDARVWAPLEATDFEHARLLAEVVAPDEFVANQAADASFWAAHVSDRRFLVPTRWELGNREHTRIREGVAGLVRRPWPAETLALRDLGTRWLYARDPQAYEQPPPDFHRTDLAADERFEPVLAGENATLYRIRWPAIPGVDGEGEETP